MSKTAWYRSLYWRIGLGFVLFLAGVLTAQAFAMMWLISRMEMSPGSPPPVVTRLVAGELSALLEANPQFDIEEYFRNEYREQPRLVAVVADGRVISSDGTTPPEDFVAAARARLRSLEESARRVGAGGSGRGLSIVKAIIEKHGGTVSVESNTGEGTTFVIRLPNP